MQCCPSGPTRIKTSFLLSFINNFSKKILFLDHDLKILALFLSLENNIENYVWNQHWIANYLIYWRSRSHMFFKISVLKSYVNFTGKHLCWSLFLKKFLTNFIKKTLQHGRFPVKLAKFLRTPFSTEQLRWLLLHVILSLWADLYSD